MTLRGAAGPISPGQPIRRRVLVIYNPVAGSLSGRRLARIVKHLARHGAVATIRRTTASGDAELYAAEASPEQFDVVVAAGGDGTINEVVNGLVGKEVPLAIIPLGTANVLAAEIGAPTRSRELARMILFGACRCVCVGVGNGRRFVMMAGVGFDAHLVARINPHVKRLLGKLTYVVEGLLGMFRFPRRRYQVLVDGASYEAASVVIANGRYYGGRFTCAPHACLDDDTLEVCLFASTGPVSVLRYGWALLRGKLHQLPDFHIVRGRDVTIEGAGSEPVQFDGDVGARLPLSVQASARTLFLVFGIDPAASTGAGMGGRAARPL